MPPDLNEILAKGSASFRRANAGLIAGLVPSDASRKAGKNSHLAPRLPEPGIKRDAAPALVGISPAQNGDVGPAAERPCVSFTLYRNRFLDPDAKYASVKPVLDGLVAAGLIPNDREADIVLHVEQIKVPVKQEGTGVVITYPANCKK